MTGMFVGDLPGRWWLPGREEHAIAGTLHIAWSERPRVTAIGLLEPASVETLFRHFQGRFVQYPVVFGRGVDGRAVTLADVRVEVRQAHLETPEDASIELLAWRVYRGAHVASEAIGFRGAQLQLEHLLDFVGRDWIPEEQVFEGGHLIEVKLAMVRDEPTVVAFSRGTLTLGLDNSLTGDRSRERGISRVARALVNLDKPISPLEWVDAYVTPLNYLLSLVTGKPIAIESLSLVGPTGEADDLAVEFMWQRPPSSTRSDRPLMPGELLFNATETPVPLRDVVDSWIRASVELRPILDLFFATRGRTPLFEAHRLLNLTQALEAFHRVRVDGHPVDPDVHSERVGRALASMAPNDRKWARYPMKQANEFILAERVAMLASAHPWMLGDVVKMTAREFGEQVAVTRNYHTHWDKVRGVGAAKGVELWPLNEQLTVLMEACLLGEIGFSEDAVSEAIRRASASYRALKLNGL
jgi:ApeA N-terminal domain 1